MYKYRALLVKATGHVTTAVRRVASARRRSRWRWHDGPLGSSVWITGKAHLLYPHSSAGVTYISPLDAWIRHPLQQSVGPLYFPFTPSYLPLLSLSLAPLTHFAFSIVDERVESSTVFGPRDLCQVFQCISKLFFHDQTHIVCWGLQKGGPQVSIRRTDIRPHTQGWENTCSRRMGKFIKRNLSSLTSWVRFLIINS